MSFIIQKLVGTKVILNEVRTSVLRIGRGTNAQIRSENPSLGLEHAEIHVTPQGYELEDKGSITGTYLNGNPAQRTRLARNDKIECADLRITVQMADPGRPMFLRVETIDLEAEAEAKAAAAAAAAPPGSPAAKAAGAMLKAPKVDFDAAYKLGARGFNRYTLTAMIFVVGMISVAMVILRQRDSAFMPGGLSEKHTKAVWVGDGKRLIDNDNCEACHTPLQGVKSEKCSGCHDTAGHENAKQQRGMCFSCHPEHQTVVLAKLSERQQAECVSCHSKKVTGPDTPKSTVTGFDKHPEFKVIADMNGKPVPVNVDTPEAKKSDKNAFEFDHRRHLQKMDFDPVTRKAAANFYIKDGRKVVVDVKCETCHPLKGGTLVEARSYDKFCKDCHPLNFRGGAKPVTHPSNLYDAMAEISNAQRGVTAMTNLSREEQTRRFVQGGTGVLGGAGSTSRAQNADQETLRAAYSLIATRCELCHVFNEKGDVPKTPVKSGKWYLGVRQFDHTIHMRPDMKLQCETCHADKLASQKTADLAMPTKKTCEGAGCHTAVAQAAAKQKGLDSCGTCHLYHAQTLAVGSGRWMGSGPIQNVAPGLRDAHNKRIARAGMFAGVPLWAIATVPAIVVLALSSLLAAMAAAKKRKEQAAAFAAIPKTALPSGGAAPPSMMTPGAPSAPAAPAPAAPAAQRAAAPMPELAVGKTVAFEFPLEELVRKTQMNMAVPGAPSAEPEEDYGSLVCTAGVLQGQRFKIDAKNGHYIGRDRDMAQIVIEDPRVSRRHVWIGVKGNRVTAVEQGSTNGTYLNALGTPRITEIVLKPGDSLIIGDNVATFKFEE